MNRKLAVPPFAHTDTITAASGSLVLTTSALRLTYTPHPKNPPLPPPPPPGFCDPRAGRVPTCQASPSNPMGTGCQKSPS